MTVYKVFYENYELKKGELMGMLIERRTDLRGMRHGGSGLRWAKLAHSAAPSPAFEGGVRERRSGSTLSKPWPSGRGVEGLTDYQFLIKYIIIGHRKIKGKGGLRGRADIDCR